MSRPVAAVLVVSLALLGCGQPGGSAGSATVVTTQRLTREEFTAKVKGKKADEVIAAVGRPDSTSEGLGNAMWTYKERTRDTISGKDDRVTYLHFNSAGKVETVSY